MGQARDLKGCYISGRSRVASREGRSLEGVVRGAGPQSTTFDVEYGVGRDGGAI